jgi:hypothetical protein
MAEAGPVEKTKLVCGMIAGDEALLDAAAERLAGHFAPVELTGETTPFDFTEYYSAQMGPHLLRRFVAFEGVFDPVGLADAKLAANAVEGEFAARAAAGPPRPVNLDPGYVAPSKLVLASMKDFSHRIYLSRGVYAEITLQWRGGRWTPLDWTFPDYASGRYDAFLTAARDNLRSWIHRMREDRTK